jgi:hypothetical protein
MDDEKEPNTINITPMSWSSYASVTPSAAGTSASAIAAGGAAAARH